MTSENKYFSTFEEYYMALEDFGERFKIDMSKYMNLWALIEGIFCFWWLLNW